jgi:hypothetical protein
MILDVKEFFEKFLTISDTMSLSAFAILLGGVIWMTELHLTTQASAASIREMQVYLKSFEDKSVDNNAELRKEFYQVLSEINQRLARIEGKLNR